MVGAFETLSVNVVSALFLVLSTIFTVGARLSGASVGLTASLRTEVTSPPLFTIVSAVIGLPDKAPETVTVAVSPVVFPVPITVLPSYNFTVEPALTPLPTFTLIDCPVKPFLCSTSLAVITGFLGLTFSVAVVEFDELS